MRVPDGHAAGRVERNDGILRWEELRGCVAFHAAVAARCCLHTRYWLVNDPARERRRWEERPELQKRGQRFSVGSGSKSVATEMDNLDYIMEHVTLDQHQCPLTSCLRSCLHSLAKEASGISARGEHVTLVICTQGRPIGKNGETGPELVKELQDELSSFAKLPVKIVVRLCTDNEEVRDTYKLLDHKFDSIDVLDDFWAESREVYLHNPWLTYAVGLHRLRESGLAPNAMSKIDEEPLSLDKIHVLCQTLFLFGEDDSLELPHPKQWDNFFEALTVLVEREKPQWNAIKKKMTPWINLAKLKAMHGGGESSHYNHNSSYKNSACQGDSTTHSRPQKPPPTKQPRHQPSNQAETLNNAKDSGLTLDEILKRWSHQPPDYELFYPLQRLLVTIPRTFPPANERVEPHDYFAKWKMFDEEAFADESGDELKELLQRAVRKAKFFLHPDKLPKDLTDNQSLLFKTLWYVVQNQEAAYLG